MAKRGAIAAGHPQTVAAGLVALEAGGNAFDAAIAALAASWITEPLLTSPAGGGFLLAAQPHQSPRLYDFFCQTPSQRSPEPQDFYPVGVDFGDAIQEFHIGLGSVAVPGLLAGLLRVQAELGRLPLSVVLEPAIVLGREGVEINAFGEYCFRLLDPIVTATPGARSLYQPKGQPLRSGDRFTNSDLAAVLEELATVHGSRFYQKELLPALADYCAAGGNLQLADLPQYPVAVRSPLAIPFGSYRLLTNPPPSSGGLLIAFALSLLNQAAIALDPLQHPQDLVQLMRLTNAARRDFLDGALQQAGIDRQFLEGPAFEQAAAQWMNRLGSTTHISVIDAEGNAASLTSSNGEGCGHVLPHTGIMLNNMLGEADLHPLGFHRWPLGQRLGSMMSPSLLWGEDDRPHLVLGSGGSNRIRTAILQVIHRWAVEGLALAEAIAAPRLHWEAGVLNWEPGWAPAGIAAASQPPETAIAWTAPNMFFGGVHAVGLTATGEFCGAGDPRRSGAYGCC